MSTLFSKSHSALFIVQKGAVERVEEQCVPLNGLTYGQVMASCTKFFSPFFLPNQSFPYHPVVFAKRTELISQLNRNSFYVHNIHSFVKSNFEHTS